MILKCISKGSYYLTIDKIYEAEVCLDFRTWEDACDYELDKQWYRENQLKELGI